METRVLIVGAGGLGGPAALYLALAGIGTIGIVDFDVVDLSNLQRQVLHQNDDVGRRRRSRHWNLHSYNPDVNVILHDTPITSTTRWNNGELRHDR
jgi:adenylyltransferase/sulfurtransferase